MQEWERRIHIVFEREKKYIAARLSEGNFDAATDEMGALANLMYLWNETTTDDFLEQQMETIVQCIAPQLAGSLPEHPQPGTVFFYDALGFDLRALALIYLRALQALGYRIVYCVDEGGEPRPHIEQAVQASGGEIVSISVKGKGQLARYCAVLDAMIAHAPEISLLQTTPHDIGGLLAFQQMAGRTRRFQINLTDHAFWLGRNAFDVCLEFRDFGAKISRTERKIPIEKLQKQLYYPVVARDVPFEGVPFARETGDFIIFSGGRFSKITDEKHTFCRIVDAILEAHPHVKFWYARSGQNEDLDRLSARHPGRVFRTPERYDLFEVLRHVDLYLNTYPMIGGLMVQYAAAAGRLPLTYHDEVEEPIRDLLFHLDELDIVRHDIPSFLALVSELIAPPEERRRRERLAEQSVLTEAQFTENLGRVLLGRPSMFPFRDQDITAEQSNDVMAAHLACIRSNGALIWRLTEEA